MKKRLLTSMLAIIMCVTGILSFDLKASAETISEDIDISYLMTVNELEFYDELDCGDLFEGNDKRERIMVFSIS